MKLKKLLHRMPAGAEVSISFLDEFRSVDRQMQVKDVDKKWADREVLLIEAINNAQGQPCIAVILD